MVYTYRKIKQYAKEAARHASRLTAPRVTKKGHLHLIRPTAPGVGSGIKRIIRRDEILESSCPRRRARKWEEQRKCEGEPDRRRIAYQHREGSATPKPRGSGGRGDDREAEARGARQAGGWGVHAGGRISPLPPDEEGAPPWSVRQIRVHGVGQDDSTSRLSGAAALLAGGVATSKDLREGRGSAAGRQDEATAEKLKRDGMENRACGRVRRAPPAENCARKVIIICGQGHLIHIHGWGKASSERGGVSRRVAVDARR
ncbi:hypothetical protein FB451DRAFT_1369618 [Mycena latifolia]|nr:hypothetical protein FB451DRAFT_1369618 [Mycena latifolia]